MPRPPKPYYSEIRNSWLVTIQGRRITLGKDKVQAFKKFHQLMGEKEQVGSEATSLYQLSQLYLQWIEQNRKPGTFEKVKRSLKNFIGFVGKKLKVSSLRGHHMTKWISSNSGWKSTTTQNINVRCVNEMLNWGVKEGYFPTNPIAHYSKPPEKSRDAYYSDEQCLQLTQAVQEMKGDIGVMVEFLLETGSRPQEVRLMQGRHLVGDTCLIPSEEAKKGRERTIYPNDRALEILRTQRSLRETSNEYLFQNSSGRMFTKDALVNAFERVEKKIGWKPRAYDLRHTWCTNALMDGLDSTTVVQLMGHQDAEMVMKVYSKLKKNPEFLRGQANKVRSRSSLPEEQVSPQE